MSKNNSIEELFQRLLSGRFSGQKPERIIDELTEAAPSAELGKFYEDQWLNTPENGKMPGSDRILKKIHRRLGINPETRSKRIILREFLKYAAIVIIAFTAGLAASKFTGKPADSVAEQVPEFCEVSVDYGSKSQINLPDGTKVKLNSGSKLTYPPDFGNSMRTVHLEGEAFFDVAKDTACPFFVNTHSISIKVLGTSFNVKSYTEENIIETTVESGTIEIYHELATNQPVMDRPPVAVLGKSDKATFVKDVSSISISSGLAASENHSNTVKKAGILVESQIETDLYTAWKDNVLKFKGEKFEDIAIKLERWYGVNIEIRHKTLKGEYFTGQFDTETIEQALDALRLTAPFRYSITKNEIVIY
jgi:transmembrane sensor